MSVLMQFDAQLLNVNQGSFIPTDGKNKGQEIKWTDLVFNNIQSGSFTLRTTLPTEIDAKMMRQELHWEVQLEPKNKNGKTEWRVSHVSGMKQKA